MIFLVALLWSIIGLVLWWFAIVPPIIGAISAAMMSLSSAGLAVLIILYRRRDRALDRLRDEHDDWLQ